MHRRCCFIGIVGWLAACGAPASQIVTVPAQLEQGIVDPGQVKSFQLWILNQVGRDSVPIQCDQLLSRALTPADKNIIPVKQPLEGDFAEGFVEIKDIPHGGGRQNRLFYVDLFDQPALIGNRIGAGCAQSITIEGGKTAQVVIEIVTPPPAVAQ